VQEAKAQVILKARIQFCKITFNITAW